MTEVTHVVSTVPDGDPHAASRLLPLVYEELRRLAAAQLAREPGGQTLQPTALVARRVPAVRGRRGEPGGGHRRALFGGGGGGVAPHLHDNRPPQAPAQARRQPPPRGRGRRGSSAGNAPGGPAGPG